MYYEITKLVKRSPKREAEFLGQMERDFHVDDGLTNSENPLPNKVDCLSCISECYSKELWNFDKAMGMDTRQYQ